MRVFENRVLRRIFGPKRGEVTGEWRKLHNEELNNPYCSPNIVRVIKSEKNEMGWACSVHGERTDVYRVLVWKPERKRPLRRPRHRCVDNINPLNAELNPICHLLALLGVRHFLHVSRIRVKMYLPEVGCVGMDWMELAQDRDRRRALVTVVMNLRVT